MERVKIFGSAGPPADGRGLFAAALVQAFPHLPVEDEVRLSDVLFRDNFIERVFAYRRLRSLLERRWTVRGLVAFHSAHTLQLMAHSPRLLEELERLVADAETAQRPQLRDAYRELFMRALATTAGTEQHVGVLQHVLRHLSQQPGTVSLHEVTRRVEAYARGLLALAEPLALLRHHIRNHSAGYLRKQTYLEPPPTELLLRNLV